MGTEAARRIVASIPAMKILALSVYDSDEFMAVVHAGAPGTILKG